MISHVSHIQGLVRSGFNDWKQHGEVSVSENDDLLIFNYTNAAQYAGTWNDFEVMSRGLIINKNTGEIVARAFDKFFNWSEGGRQSQARIVSVTEKMDGSLGILYRHNGEYKIATRGSFVSEQAAWATDHLYRFSPHIHDWPIPNEWTLLFEIIYPGNRAVVDYRGFAGLVLLAIRNRLTGEYVPFRDVKKFADTFGFMTPKVYNFDLAADIISNTEALGADNEGYVVEFADGQRFKFKGARYLQLHKLICSLSFKNTLAAVSSGTVDYIREQVPDEFLGEFEGWVSAINDTAARVTQLVDGAYSNAPQGNRKDFALWVTQNHKDIAPLLFARLDGKDINPLIYRSSVFDSIEGLRSGE